VSLATDPAKVHEEKLRKIRRVEKAISRLQRMGLLYLRGGARQYDPQRMLAPTSKGQGWTDCSGLVQYVLAIAGIQLRNPAGWTGTLVAEGEAGTSPYLTLYLKEPEQAEGHVILRLRHHPRWRRLLGLAAKWRWAECGGSDNPQPGGGPTWFRPSDGRVAEFPYQRRFEAL
jgi:hypothetical protein